MSIELNSIRITISDLTIQGWDGEESVTWPVSRLADNPETHIHGRLTIDIGGRTLPYVSYFGDDDACFDYWFHELNELVASFDTMEFISYTYDEGEQGQPAYLFEKEGDTVLISIIDSSFSGGNRDLEWQRVPFSYTAFRSEYRQLVERFVETIRIQAPTAYKAWMKNSVPFLTT